MSRDDNIFSNFLASSSRTKTVAIAAGGALALGLGGYLIYRSLSKGERPHENSTEAHIFVSPPGSSDPQSLASFVQTGNLSTSDYGKTRADRLARAVAVKEKGNKLFKGDKFDEAIQCYSEAIEICPPEEKQELAKFYQNRAAAYDKMNELEKAYDDCTAALNLDKKYVKALFRRGDVCEKMQRLHEAMQAFMKCCIMENFQNFETSKRADKALRDLSQKLAKEYVEARGEKLLPFSSSTIQDMMHSYASDPVITPHINLPGASDHFHAGDSSLRPNRMANGYAHGEPEEPLTGYRKAINCLVSKQYDQIIDHCTEEIDNPEQSAHLVECLLLRATFYYFKGDFKNAKTDLDEVLRLLNDKNDESSKHFLCNAYIKLSLMEHQKSNVDKCFEYLGKAEKIMPENPDVYSLRGQVYCYSKENTKANVDFARCAALRPDFAHFAVQLCGAELKAAAESPDDFALPKVIRDFEDLVQKFPNSAEVNLIYAQVLCDAAQYQTAVKYFDKAQKLDPNNPNVISQRGLLELYFNNEEGMLKLLDQALKIDPHCLMALEIQAQYHSKRNDVPKMIESYNKALEMARSESEVAHFISMRETTLCQIKVAEELLIGTS